MDRLIWLSADEIIAIHQAVLRRYGGAAGIRDNGLLEAAINRPRQLLAYSEVEPDLCALAAAYITAIVRNHPFIDGNKRTGFLAVYAFLDINGLELEASEEEATQMVQSLAASTVKETAFAQWLREHV